VTAILDVDSAEAWQFLRRSQELTGPRIRAAVERLSEPVRTVTRYHFGWCDESGRLADGNWGKGIRGALVLASAQALGAGAQQALNAAAAVEMVHNFSVLHDDLMDGDLTRRGRAAAWKVFGAAQAVLAGDALLVLALDELVGGEPSPGQAASLHGLCHALLELVAGQDADLAFENRDDVDLEECLAMAAGKTASLFAGACALGALAAGGSEERTGCLRGFGHHLGLAFQLVDDLLGIWGDTRATGKPVGSDLRLRKKSLPVVAALCSDTLAGDRLAALYRGGQPLTEAQVAEAAALIEEAGGRRWAEREAVRQQERAAERLAAAAPDPVAAKSLLLLVGLITHRAR
jgi:geranylgeranyl diphosphate synthase type I